MKKFRKSFVILPALATMALTTVASVTGTVAWFVANQSVTATASSFIANYNDGNLTVTTASVQSAASASGSVQAVEIGTDNKSVTVKDDVLFTDASYDAASDVLWSDEKTNDGSNPTSFESKGGSTAAASGWVSDATNKEVFGITWTYTFQYSFASSTANKFDLCFDASNSSMTSADDSSFNGVAGGFRIALTCGGKTIVCAPIDNAKNTYIKDASGTTGTYSLTKIAGTTPTLTEGQDHSSSDAYLGTFQASTAYAKSTLSVRCVAWFEGTDTDHVIVEKTIAAVSATLGFKAVKGATNA